jgi:mono/diheme cytochrome c family protein
VRNRPAAPIVRHARLIRSDVDPGESLSSADALLTGRLDALTILPRDFPPRNCGKSDREPLAWQSLQQRSIRRRYAGPKSMIYSGLGPDDPRVQAALKWIKSRCERLRTRATACREFPKHPSSILISPLSAYDSIQGRTRATICSLPGRGETTMNIRPQVRFNALRESSRSPRYRHSSCFPPSRWVRGQTSIDAKNTLTPDPSPVEGEGRRTARGEGRRIWRSPPRLEKRSCPRSQSPNRALSRRRPFRFLQRCLLPLCLLLLLITVPAQAAEPSRTESAAERGYRWLTTKAYLPADFDQEVFDNLWKVWPTELREKARDATPAERRRMTFSRYGLAERPAGDDAPTALGYVPDGKAGWVMNCLACHTGKVAGQVILGAPNSLYALATLTEEVRQTKLLMLKPLTHMDLGSLKMPLGSTRGTTNAVMFGVALGALRDPDLNYRRDVSVPRMRHHDMDAPPWWNVRRKKNLYSDGFVAKSHRPLLQFVMVPENSGATLRSWEEEYADILAWIESLEPPKYPGSSNRPLAAQGKIAFERVCAQCHGTYGENESYPNRIVALEEVGTDPVRLQSLSVEYRQAMQDGWYGEYGAKPYVTDPGGYVAPPLNGIWASAPYLHNGSVPTLWHVLHPDERPTIWRRTEEGYDHSRMGLEVTTFDELPASAKSAAEKREYFDTRRPGKSAAGHPFPNELSEEEKQAVLEYLKTL